MAYDYTNLSEMIEVAKERSGAADADNALISDWLALSYGLKDGVIYYRPYWVAAKYREQNPAHHELASGAGATFTGMKTPIESYYSMQSALDLSLGLVIPESFQIKGGQLGNQSKTASYPLNVVWG